ncbi:hypothetical protein BST61_g2461 [Cercospora zeina]
MSRPDFPFEAVAVASGEASPRRDIALDSWGVIRNRLPPSSDRTEIYQIRLFYAIRFPNSNPKWKLTSFIAVAAFLAGTSTPIEDKREPVRCTTIGSSKCGADPSNPPFGNIGFKARREEVPKRKQDMYSLPWRSGILP